ncbi:phage antirepressor KilAC domain-containing protein [Haemophilus haemolyticus]|uniref:phage antirepressor KilAC domain-containing protein n=1 Tax=Haemophilus haemolyticus TaxID=726 RepID=UPI000E567C4A|nr:phage regulatory protein/antirepressor Ant [Haemophilus haemolyticus]
MSQLLTITKENTSALTMGSREIANLCGKDHRHVVRDIEVMFEQLGINSKEYVQIWTHPQNGQSYREFMLPKNLTFTLVAGYNVILRKRIIDRWLELENQQKPTALIPQSFSEALMLAAKLQAEKERNAPKVAFVDHYVEVGTSKSFRETAKILKMPERALVNRLVEDKYLYRQSGVLLPYQSAHTKDLFTVKTGTAEHGHNYTQTRVTSKGIEFIASRYASELML